MNRSRRALSWLSAAVLVGAPLGGLELALHALLRLRPIPTGHDVLVTAIATLPSALLLLPLCIRVDRWIDTLLHGPQFTSSGVLAAVLGDGGVGVGEAPDLARVAEVVGVGLGARVCRLVVHRPGLGDRSYVWTADPDGDGVDGVDGVDPEDPGDLLEVPIRLAGEQVGALGLDRATGVGRQAHREQLLHDVADSLGAVLQVNRLGIELERQLRAAGAHALQIAESRRRLVAEMDAERRRVERDLHDGAQHHLVSLRLSLGLVEHQVRTGRLDDARASLVRVSERIGLAESILVRTVTGVSTPVFADVGLAGALDAELAHEPGTRLETGDVGPADRFGEEIESAVWFCCLEAVGNARKHAPGAAVVVSLDVSDGRLCFAVHDEGPGWDSGRGQAGPGRGLRNVRIRLDAVGGTLEVRSRPGSGTQVSGSVPLPPGSGSRTAAADQGPEDEGGLVGSTRAALRAAATVYRDLPGAGRIRELAGVLTGPARADGTGRPDHRADVLRAWTVLSDLESLVRADPPPAGGPGLRRLLEQARSGSHDRVELDALDLLESGSRTTGLDAAELASASRLLGARGRAPRVRLGLAPDAGDAEVRAAAAAEISRWRTLGARLAGSSAGRSVATAVVRSGEQILLSARPPEERDRA